MSVCREFAPIPRGLTMIEILVVTIVVAILSSVVMISLDISSDQKKIREIAEDFYDQLILAQDESLFLGELVGIELYQNGYRFLSWYNPATDVEMIDQQRSEEGLDSDSGSASQEGVILSNQDESEVAPIEFGYWQPIDDDPMRSTFRLPEPFAMSVEVAGTDIDLPELLEDEKEAEWLAKLDLANPEQNPFNPVIVFLPSGEASEFVVTLYSNDNSDLDHLLASDLLGRVTLTRPGEPDEED